MASVPKGSRKYDNIHAEGNSRMHLGDVYNNYQSPDERAVVAILDSLRYPGMSDRRDALAEAHERTFDWTFLEGKTRFLRENHEFDDQESERYHTVDMSFKSWLQQEGQGLFCVMGKPGSGKSTFMCVQERKFCGFRSCRMSNFAYLVDLGTYSHGDLNTACHYVWID